MNMVRKGIIEKITLHSLILLFGVMVILVPMLLAVFSCAGLFLLENLPFYENSGDIDSMRIPLIEPYKAIRLNGSDTWSIDLIIPPEEKEIYYYLNIYDVDKIAVEHNVIMAHSPHVTSGIVESIGERVLHWFVIVPNQKIETGFATEEEFLMYVQSLGIQEPLWMEINQVYQKFVETGCLDWIPNCR